MKPADASRSFFTLRCVTTVLRPDARVTGAEPAKALTPGVGEPGAVVADLGKDPCPGEIGEPGEAGDHS